MTDIRPGQLVWVVPGASVGREQAGRRPALIVSGVGYLAAVSTLALIVPLTSVDRAWPNHVQVKGGTLKGDSWAMVEQLRAISRARIVGTAGQADELTLATVKVWMRDFLEL